METPSQSSTPPWCFRPEHGITMSALPRSISGKPIIPIWRSFPGTPAGFTTAPSSSTAGLLTQKP